jgi:hypothetical protein
LFSIFICMAMLKKEMGQGCLAKDWTSLVGFWVLLNSKFTVLFSSLLTCWFERFLFKPCFLFTVWMLMIGFRFLNSFYSLVNLICLFMDIVLVQSC